MGYGISVSLYSGIVQCFGSDSGVKARNKSRVHREIVQCQSSCNAASARLPKKFHGAHTVPNWPLCRGFAENIP